MCVASGCNNIDRPFYLKTFLSLHKNTECGWLWVSELFEFKKCLAFWSKPQSILVNSNILLKCLNMRYIYIYMRMYTLLFKCLLLLRFFFFLEVSADTDSPLFRMKSADTDRLIFLRKKSSQLIFQGTL